jgi:molybdate transport system permease protein
MIAGSMPGETRTVPLEIHSLLGSPGGGAAAARLVVVSIVMSALALALGEHLERRASAPGGK